MVTSSRTSKSEHIDRKPDPASWSGLFVNTELSFIHMRISVPLHIYFQTDLLQSIFLCLSQPDGGGENDGCEPRGGMGIFWTACGNSGDGGWFPGRWLRLESTWDLK